LLLPSAPTPVQSVGQPVRTNLHQNPKSPACKQVIHARTKCGFHHPSFLIKRRLNLLWRNISEIRPAMIAREYGIPAVLAREYGIPAVLALEYGIPAALALEVARPGSKTECRSKWTGTPERFPCKPSDWRALWQEILKDSAWLIQIPSGYH